MRLVGAADAAFWFTTVGAVGRWFALRPLPVSWPALRFAVATEVRIFAPLSERLVEPAAILVWPPLVRAVTGCLPLLLQKLVGFPFGVGLGDLVSLRLDLLAEFAGFTFAGCLPPDAKVPGWPAVPRVGGVLPLGGGGRLPFGG